MEPVCAFMAGPTCPDVWPGVQMLGEDDGEILQMSTDLSFVILLFILGITA